MNNMSITLLKDAQISISITLGNLIGLILFLSSFLLPSAAFSEDQNTNPGSGMINRTQLVSTKIKASNLDRISTDISKIVDSLNNILTNPIDDEDPEETEKEADIVQKTQDFIVEPERVIPKEIKIAKPETKPEFPLPKPQETSIKLNDTIPAVQLSPIPPLKPAPSTKPIIQTEVKVEKIIVKDDNISNKNKYLKIGHDGNTLPRNSEIWTCVEDINNGLIWEVKSNDDSLRDKNNSYSWFQPSSLEANHGIADGGQCRGEIACDTESYTQAINKQNYCGYSDWRLPTREEMLSIVNMESTTSTITINSDYFPETLPSWYWTASSNDNHPEHAWYVLFRNGIAINDLKDHPKHIRLVRSQTKKTS